MGVGWSAKITPNTFGGQATGESGGLCCERVASKKEATVGGEVSMCDRKLGTILEGSFSARAGTSE